MTLLITRKEFETPEMRYTSVENGTFTKAFLITGVEPAIDDAWIATFSTIMY